jgi:hypothetical protein
MPAHRLCLVLLSALILSGGVRAAEPAVKLVFACRADSDLYRVLGATGVQPPRYDTPAAAVAAAPDGAGVLVLADGYPAQTTAVPDEVFEQAKSKRLRLYVEYPAALPGLKCEPPRGTQTERAVVRSEFFGRELGPGRILAINGLHFVPVAVEKSHLVAARVAGFDSAAFGLPKQTYPLLFEHPQGNLLIATTRLSQFVAGRYAPQDAWQTLWRGVLTWLAPDAPPVALKWTPVVRASFGRDDPLPADAERQALHRGADWFIKSKLLLDRSRLGDDWKKLQPAGGLLAKHPSGLVPTPPPDAPVGDGSLGILEAPLSVIQPDGSQLQSVSRRGDCHGEAAMALAFGGTLANDAQKQTIARNLLDFWYFTSDACKRERAKPKHGAYGLIAWGIDSPAWYVANYGDDNARLLMGTLATAALMGDDRWDELILRCLLANLRTTGRLGFRDDRIDLPALSAQGWLPFFQRRITSYSPHMEAYLWACYLWAYRHTGCELFYERAETALRMTMAQYTDGWRWTNGLAQEKARILLPLAWLVRAKDTPEHRDWLRKAVAGLAALQEPCGAIREELGLPGRGMFPPPASNEAYGTNEASLIQQNGDPVSDLLYTTNFAFVGLHEAAAAGDQQAAEAEAKLAAFLCRIQVRSETQPSLDGGWFRAFDFRRWEPWGSNADAGWGAWAIESGWTQGWITSIFGLRQMKTSLWDLTAETKLARHFDRLRREMLSDEALAALKPIQVRHAAVGKSVRLAVAPSPHYPGNGAPSLSDGLLGPADHTGPEWLGFEGRDLEATIDLGVATEIRSLAANFLRSHRVGIFLPKRVEFSVSDDGKTFRPIGKVEPAAPARDMTPQTIRLTVTAQKTSARYVRLHADNFGPLPTWVIAGSVPAWLFADEFLVNPE